MTDQTAADVQFGRQFVLVRNGAVIADGVEFPDGHVAIHWTGAKWPTLTPHQTMDAAIVAHSQNGAVRVVWQLTGIPQAEYGSVWPELVGWAQAAQEDGEQIDPAQLLEYMRELKQRALAPVRQWMDSVRGAAAQSSSPHRPPCVDGDHCGEAAHCPPIVSATEDAARQAAAQPAAAEVTFPACGSHSLPISTGEVVRCVLVTGHAGQCQSATEHPYVSWPNPSNVAWHRAARLAAPTNHTTEQRARARLAALIGYEPGEHDAKFEQHLDAYRAAILNSAATEPPLTAAERKFLAWALGCAAAVMLSEDGFTDEDEAALASLRRLAAGAES